MKPKTPLKRARALWLLVIPALVAVLAYSAPRALACGGYMDAAAVAQMVEETADDADWLIHQLRADRQEGVDALRARLEKVRATEPSVDRDAKLARLTRAIDEVAQQLGAENSGLFWFTDLEEAKAHANTAGKPILSLRLLGKLTEELSCANSRFFRAILYADPEVSHAMREGFVLHWSSERDAPRITIDFGDGRIMTRTITGNSAHYVLDQKGRVLDALPGLYGPATFRAGLERARALHASLGEPGEHPMVRLAKYHNEGLEALTAAWRADLAAIGVNPTGVALRLTEAGAANHRVRSRVPAPEAAMRAVGKSMVEMPVLAAMEIDEVETLRASTTDTHLSTIAELLAHRTAARLSPASEAIARAEATEVSAADALIAKLHRSIARDTVHNEYRLHTQIHRWLAEISEPAPPTLAVFNERVYRELFLTPREDAWLGLHDPSVFTAISGAGLSERP
ncbi:MAG: hypothetical protein ACYTFT_09935 [Planctomycetota bacterium]|jgi:hypothetical protein